MKTKSLIKRIGITVIFLSVIFPGINCEQKSEQKKYEVRLKGKVDFVFIHYEYWDGRTFLIIGSDPETVYKHFNILHGYVFAPTVLILSPNAVNEISKYVSNHCIPSNQHLGTNIFYCISLLKKDSLKPLPGFFHRPNADHFSESSLANCFLVNQTQANTYFNKLVEDLYDKGLQLDALRLGKSLYHNGYYVYDTSYSRRF